MMNNSVVRLVGAALALLIAVLYYSVPGETFSSMSMVKRHLLFWTFIVVECFGIRLANAGVASSARRLLRNIPISLALVFVLVVVDAVFWSLRGTNDVVESYAITVISCLWFTGLKIFLLSFVFALFPIRGPGVR